MALWGNDIKPKNLTEAEKKEVYATASGWVREAGSILSGNDNTAATPEVLVAVGQLATNMGAGDITEIEFITTAFDKSAGGTLQVRVRFNEDVTVTGTPQLSVTNGNEGTGTGRGPHVLSYTSGSDTNELVFGLTIGAADAATEADDVLTIGANAMSLNGGTVKDRGTATNSTITNASSIGTAAGSITVVA
jgi:hypothetical protein